MYNNFCLTPLKGIRKVADSSDDKVSKRYYPQMVDVTINEAFI